MWRRCRRPEPVAQWINGKTIPMTPTTTAAMAATNVQKVYETTRFSRPVRALVCFLNLLFSFRDPLAGFG
jgi:hypothetical protein